MTTQPKTTIGNADFRTHFVFFILTFIIVIFGISCFFFFKYDIRILGGTGLSAIALIGIFTLLIYYPIIKAIHENKIVRLIARIISTLSYIYFAIILVPFLGYFLVIMPMGLFLGSERKVLFNNENYTYEKQYFVPRSGGRYVYCLYKKHFFYDKKVKGYYGRPERLESMEQINEMKSRYQ